jgi:hypothetical protein
MHLQQSEQAGNVTLLACVTLLHKTILKEAGH